MKSLVGFDDGKRKLGSYFHLGVFRGQSHSLGITIIFQAVYANELLVLLSTGGLFNKQVRCYVTFPFLAYGH